MRMSFFTPEAILQALRHAGAGITVVDICWRLGVREGTFGAERSSREASTRMNCGSSGKLREENRD